jgi:hypothetical protein
MTHAATVCGQQVDGCAKRLIRCLFAMIYCLLRYKEHLSLPASWFLCDDAKSDRRHNGALNFAEADAIALALAPAAHD